MICEYEDLISCLKGNWPISWASLASFLKSSHPHPLLTIKPPFRVSNIINGRVIEIPKDGPDYLIKLILTVPSAE